MGSTTASEQNYVLGFAFNLHNQVLLIKKNRPKWMAGKLNGIGGKIKSDESPSDAMFRECLEETGLRLFWRLLCVKTYNTNEGSAKVFVFYSIHNKSLPFIQNEDERLELYNPLLLLEDDCVKDVTTFIDAILK